MNATIILRPREDGFEVKLPEKSDKFLRYDVIGASIEGVTKHPQLDMKDLGFHVIASEPFSISDSWVFQVEECIEPLPSYIEKWYPINFTELIN